MPRASHYPGGGLETVRCDLCGASNDRTFLSLNDALMNTTEQTFRVARCLNCDLLYLNPRPSPHTIGEYYPDSYAPFTRRGLSASARTWLYRRSVRELWQHLAPPRQILDVGCGTGELLHEIRTAGNANVFGIEPSPQAAHLARERLNLDVCTGTLEHAALDPESVDTVLLSHVLEHLHSPKRTMSEIERILKPGGVVAIWVPNARSLAAAWLGSDWMGWDVPRHLYAFTPGTLHRLITRSGLVPGEITHEQHGLEWAWGLRLKARNNSTLQKLEPLLTALHPVLAAGLTPLGVVSAALGRSGRIRMLVRKPVT